MDTFYHGDYLDVMQTFPDDSIDLIVTSPPYHDVRKGMYEGVAADKYVDWFLPRSRQMLRILKPTGSFVLNIKEGTKDGERLLYVYDLVIALKRQTGFRFIDDLIWVKKDIFPGKFRYRLKDGWEHLYHFGKTKETKVCFDNVKQPASEDAIRRRLPNLKNRNYRIKSKNYEGYAVNDRQIRYNEFRLPSNIIHSSTSNVTGKSQIQKHPAKFPESIPEFFIKYLTDKGDTVLDPFVGSGTTVRVANRLERRGIGIDIKKEYIDELTRQTLDFHTTT